jgi:hypothetical protein
MMNRLLEHPKPHVYRLECYHRPFTRGHLEVEILATILSKDPSISKMMILQGHCSPTNFMASSLKVLPDSLSHNPGSTARADWFLLTEIVRGTIGHPSAAMVHTLFIIGCGHPRAFSLRLILTTLTHLLCIFVQRRKTPIPVTYVGPCGRCCPHAK